MFVPRQRLVVLSPQRPGFDTDSLCVVFLMDKAALRKIILGILPFYSLRKFSPVLSTHISVTYD